jgi:hypothetical protein
MDGYKPFAVLREVEATERGYRSYFKLKPVGEDCRRPWGKAVIKLLAFR